MQRLMPLLQLQPWKRFYLAMVLLCFIWLMVEPTLDFSMVQTPVKTVLITKPISLLMIMMLQLKSLAMWTIQNSKASLRSVIEKYSRTSLPQFPSNNVTSKFGTVKVSKVASLFESLDVVCDPVEVIETEFPVSMESAGQMFGFLLYVSEYPGKASISILSIPKVHDRAQIFVSCSLMDDRGSPRYVGTIERWSNRALAIPNIKCSSNTSLFILVENMGRVNYGPYIYDRKGILSDVILDGSILHSWKMYPISFGQLNNLLKDDSIVQVTSTRTGLWSEEPRFYEGRLYIDPLDKIEDTFISFRGWNKGVAFINNFNIGRFWPSFGPQCTLYVPAPILRHGENLVVILELHAPKTDLTIEFVENPDFTCGSKSRHV
ncbi:beta-galactosidase 8 [Iris pallida]|uniref:Beta-galactosidase 8 n=1 Tax=Iris pallida TaxID=29817 RepID=A0AAX6DSA3_IRIPA|nr:beta-galactosidase 8 [Iris pallida]